MAFLFVSPKKNQMGVHGVNNGNTKVAREYIEKYGTMPDGSKTPMLKLARMIYNEESEKGSLRWNSIESARATLKKIYGKSGTQLADKSLYEKEHRPFNPYNLPKSDEKPYIPHLLDGKIILCLFDIHCPYHNIPALSAAIKYGKKYKPDTIFLGGDVIDFYQISDFAKEKDKKQIVDELEVLSNIISVLRINFPKAQIVFKEGNHEERYNRFLYMKAGELSGIKEISLESIIRKRIGDIQYVGDKRIVKAGNLNLIHGHEFKGGISTPVNIARGLFLRAKVSCMQGHNHATSEHTETDMNQKITTTWSVGCLSELHPQYMPLNKWNHGFAIVEVDQSGEFEVTNKRIHKGEVL